MAHPEFFDEPPVDLLRKPGIPYLTYQDDIESPTGPLTAGQVPCRACKLDERSRAASDPDDLLCDVCRAGGDALNGHQFHFTVFVQGSSRVGDGQYKDEPRWENDEPFGVTVRAWNLADACRKAAITPLSKWTHGEGD